MLKEGELETVLPQLIPEGNKSRVSGYGLETYAAENVYMLHWIAG